MKLQLLTEQYARALRVIGQDLDDLAPESLTIEMSGNNFVARGYGKVAAASLPRLNEERRRLPAIWQKSHRSSPTVEPSRSVFVRTYTPDAINNLDEMARGRRRSSAQRPDLHSLAEKLRMIGRILDEKNGVLINLSQDGSTITFKYRDTRGEIHSEEYSNLTLYKLQQHYYSGRCYQPEDPWQDVRR
jgi:hypothetical protein